MTDEGGEPPNGPTRYEFDWETGRRKKVLKPGKPFIDPDPVANPRDTSLCTAGGVIPCRGRHYSWKEPSFRECRIHDRPQHPDSISTLLWLEFDTTKPWRRER